MKHFKRKPQRNIDFNPRRSFLKKSLLEGNISIPKKTIALVLLGIFIMFGGYKYADELEYLLRDVSSYELIKSRKRQEEFVSIKASIVSRQGKTLYSDSIYVELTDVEDDSLSNFIGKNIDSLKFKMNKKVEELIIEDLDYIIYKIHMKVEETDLSFSIIKDIRKEQPYGKI